MDHRLFWWSLYGYPVLWGFFFLVSLLKFDFQWLLVVIVAITLNAANIVGYTKCDKDAKKKLVHQFGDSIVGSIFKRGFGPVWSADGSPPQP